MTNIETPEGWERRGPCFTREYNGRYAVLAKPKGEIWNARVYRPERFDGEWLDSIPEAVAWANQQLGVPKPVEVVEEKFADGSRVFKDSEGKRVAHVQCVDIGRWFVHYGKWVAQFTSDDEACDTARRYVRGDA